MARVRRGAGYVSKGGSTVLSIWGGINILLASSRVTRTVVINAGSLIPRVI